MKDGELIIDDFIRPLIEAFKTIVAEEIGQEKPKKK